MDISPTSISSPLTGTLLPESPASKLEKVKARLAAERGISKFHSPSASPRPATRSKSRKNKRLTDGDEPLGSSSAQSSDSESDEPGSGLAKNPDVQDTESPGSEEGGSFLGRMVGTTVGGVTSVVGGMAAAFGGAVFNSALVVMEKFGGQAESSDDESEKIPFKYPSKRTPPADPEMTCDPQIEADIVTRSAEE